MTANTIDLSLIPLPDAVEEIEPEIILSEWIQSLIDREPSYTGLVESDPAYIQGEALAYRETLLRQRINEGVKATFLATAVSKDLDVKALDYGVVRLLLDPGDPQAVPPRDPVYESDDALRARTWLSMQALSVAGPSGAYQFHALSASPDVMDARPYGPETHNLPGEVHVYVLSVIGDGTASAELLSVVDTALSDEDVRPLTDYVTVKSAVISAYTIDAVLHILPGPDAESVKNAALEAAQRYADGAHRIGKVVGWSGIDGALHQPGVEWVTLNSPAADIFPGTGEAAYCSGITLSVVTEEMIRHAK